MVLVGWDEFFAIQTMCNLKSWVLMFFNGLKFEGLNQVEIAKALRCVGDPDVHWSQVSSGLQNKFLGPAVMLHWAYQPCQKLHFCVGCSSFHNWSDWEAKIESWWTWMNFVTSRWHFCQSNDSCQMIRSDQFGGCKNVSLIQCFRFPFIVSKVVRGWIHIPAEVGFCQHMVIGSYVLPANLILMFFGWRPIDARSKVGAIFLTTCEVVCATLLSVLLVSGSLWSHKWHVWENSEFSNQKTKASWPQSSLTTSSPKRCRFATWTLLAWLRTWGSWLLLAWSLVSGWRAQALTSFSAISREIRTSKSHKFFAFWHSQDCELIHTLPLPVWPRFFPRILLSNLQEEEAGFCPLRQISSKRVVSAKAFRVGNAVSLVVPFRQKHEHFALSALPHKVINSVMLNLTGSYSHKKLGWSDRWSHMWAPWTLLLWRPNRFSGFQKTNFAKHLSMEMLDFCQAEDTDAWAMLQWYPKIYYKYKIFKNVWNL